MGNIAANVVGDNERVQIRSNIVDLREKLVSRLEVTKGHSYVPKTFHFRDVSAKEFAGTLKVSYPIYGNVKNHMPFLNPEILQHILPHMIDCLPAVLEVCPHWLVTILDFIKNFWTKKAVRRFIEKYSDYLEYQGLTLAHQPLYTETFGIRVDALLYARVLPLCRNKCIEIQYSVRSLFARPDFDILHPSLETATGLSASQSGSESGSGSDSDSNSDANSQSNSGSRTSDAKMRESDIVRERGPRVGGKIDTETQQCCFRFEGQRAGSHKRLWFRLDTTKFHGDEARVAESPNTPYANVGDLLEIPINLSNPFLVADPESFRWYPPRTISDPADKRAGVHCLLDSAQVRWQHRKHFQQTSSNVLPPPMTLTPHLQHIETTYSGVSLVISKSLYRAVAGGSVCPTISALGFSLFVLDSNATVVVPLKRRILDHDRFCNFQIRKGDEILIYQVQGGPDMNHLGR